MKIVTLTDATVVSLSKNPAARAALPALTNLYNGMLKKKSGCSRCGKRRKMSATVLAVRTALAGNPSSLSRIKKILRADRLVMYIRGPRGITQRKEF